MLGRGVFHQLFVKALDLAVRCLPLLRRWCNVGGLLLLGHLLLGWLMSFSGPPIFFRGELLRLRKATPEITKGTISTAAADAVLCIVITSCKRRQSKQPKDSAAAGSVKRTSSGQGS